MTSEEFLAELDTLDVGVVKERIASGVYLRPFKDLAQGWVEQKEAGLVEEQLDLALRAHRDARWANWIAIVAVVIAAATHESSDLRPLHTVSITMKSSLCARPIFLSRDALVAPASSPFEGRQR
jgi:hypothetical protein